MRVHHLSYGDWLPRSSSHPSSSLLRGLTQRPSHFCCSVSCLQETQLFCQSCWPAYQCLCVPMWLRKFSDWKPLPCSIGTGRFISLSTQFSLFFLSLGCLPGDPFTTWHGLLQVCNGGIFHSKILIYGPFSLSIVHLMKIIIAINQIQVMCQKLARCFIDKIFSLNNNITK